MNKDNVFRSSNFYMAEGDVLHMLIRDETGASVLIGLFNNLSPDTIEAFDNGPVLDGDGYNYKTVIINNQQWFAENMRTTKYIDGTPIPEITNEAAWQADVTGAYCWYNNDAVTYDAYGKLYNWYAVTNAHNIAPIGWRVATYNDYNNLFTYLGGLSVGGGILKETGTTHWITPNTGAVDTYGFKILPNGRRLSGVGFSLLGYSSYGWTSSESLGQGYFNSVVYNSTSSALQLADKSWGMSIRCVKDI